MPLKVLVVDDEEGVLDIIQRMLKLKCGYQTVGTGDGEEAVKMYIEHKPDVCILDVNLDASKLNGIDVLREIKKINPAAKCIMITRVAEEPTIKAAKELGAKAYLLKPVESGEWVKVVKEVTEGI